MHPIVRQGGHRFRRHVRRVWASRGGGFYGFVATLTFLYLEAMSLVGDVTSIGSMQIGLGGVIDFVVQNLVTGFLNVVWASIWPVEWIKRFGVSLTSAALLVFSYFLFQLIQPTVLRLLQEPAEAAPAPANRA